MAFQASWVRSQLAVGEVVLSSRRGGVAPVGDGVDLDVRDPRRPRRVRQGKEVILVAVHPAVGNEPDEVQARALGLGEGLDQDRVGGEFPIGDGLVDAGEVLVDDAPGAEVEVPHLGISHLPLRQAHIQARGAELGHGIALVQGAGEGNVREPGAVAEALGALRSRGVVPPSVADDEYDRFLRHMPE